jgi:anti-anti-sigma factor
MGLAPGYAAVGFPIPFAWPDGSPAMLKPSVQIREEDGVLTAEFWDCLRLDPAPVTTLRLAFEEYRKKTGRSELVVDLNGVTFAGSASLGGFLGIRRAGARLIFCNVDSNVLEVFRVSKLDPLFHFAADKPAALAMAKAPADPANLIPPPPPDRGASPLRRRRTS